MMIKIDLAREIAEKLNVTLKEGERFLDAFMETVTATLTKGKKVQLAGFGTWEVREYASRTGRNPKTGEALEIAAFNYPAFKPGKHLKDSVAGRQALASPASPEKTGEEPAAKEKATGKQKVS